MSIEEVYLALGGNLGDPLIAIQNALKRLSSERKIVDLEFSKFYYTTPVSDISQGMFVNAVCRFKTFFSVHHLWNFLENLERDLGKVPKKKNEPRVIDIDLLFYGNRQMKFSDLEIPHPRWRERLFVLRPLLDLTHTISLKNEFGKEQVLDLQEIIGGFMNLNHEIVEPIKKVIV